MALGTGGIKPNVSAFGADQFDEADPQDRREKTSFFNWWVLPARLPGSMGSCLWHRLVCAPALGGVAALRCCKKSGRANASRHPVK